MSAKIDAGWDDRMLDEGSYSHPFAHVLSGSPHFAQPEPISDIAEGETSDLYLALARTIEREVIPRLLLNTRAEIARRNLARTAPAPRATRDVVAFCQLILTGELADAEAYVARDIGSGATPESLLLDLFAPTARRLGELWESDDCTFVDVTIALGKLQQILRLFSRTYRQSPDPRKLGFRALIATVPSNQHIFGILIVEELFRRAGWNAMSLPSPTKDELLEAVREEWFAVVGLSIGCDSSAATVASLITGLRKASLNRSILVLVGGRYVSDNPDKAKQFGADLSGADAVDSIKRSQEFLKTIGR